LYRLIFNFFPYHLTTSNQFEVNALVASGNWTIEQISGYVRPAPSDQVQPLQLLSRRPRVPAYAPQSRFVNSGAADIAAAATIDTSHHFGERPRLNAVVNGASFVGGGIAPGEALALFGSGFGPETPIVRAAHLRGQENAGPDLAGIKIFFDEIPAIVTVAANGESRAVAPLEIADREQVRVWIEYAGVNSNVLTLPVAVAAPGLFTADYSGQGQAVASDEAMSVNSTENPAARGAVILLYFTGEGVTEKLGNAGVPKPVLPVSVYIGGVAADVLEVAGVPSVPGVMQVRARIPVDVPAGPAVPVGVAVGGVASAPGVTLAIH
jgi:uncharacterized protein (TIGR03437 family)